MSGSCSPDYKALFLKAEEERKREAELRRQAEERNRPTTFPEFIRHCHDLLWRPLRSQTPSEQDLETYERLAVEDHVHDIVAELCKIPEAREEFWLGDGLWFDNHPNALDEDEEVDTIQPSTMRPSRPDQFCIYHADGNRPLRCEPAVRTPTDGFLARSGPT
ncbi:uncharacterized protein BJX67DRAFT_376054 [Aspergillus lucknowensis]|uniref:Uncharacterized protein n=1 Tax=Aspergillus lucknowensis TaxID=176173 RepID=A0ABR4L5F7_9EURO